jgi:diguanylate cyclase (GGDEF)-like protein
LAADLAAFGQLIRTIVPQAHVVAIYDGDAQACWASEDGPHDSLRSLAADLLAGAEGGGPSNSMRCEAGAAANYAFLVRGPSAALLGVLTIAIAGPFRREELLLPAALEARIAPLLVLLAQDLQRSRELETVHQRLENTMQLEWLHDVAKSSADDGATSDPIERLTSSLAATLDADVVIASIPGYQFERSHARPGAPLTDLEALRILASRDLAQRAAQDNQALRVSKARTAAASPAFRFASVPLRHHGVAVGVLAAFANMSRKPFGVRDTRLAEHCAARLVELVEARVDRATGLPTRAVLEDYVLAAQAGKSGAQCLVYLDVDQMHALNDLFGFDTGDDVLRRLATLWPAGRISAGGLMGRLSGDRFAAVLDACTLNQGRSWAEAARLNVEQLTLPPACKGFKLSASFGVAAVEPGERFEAALARAATAGRAAKDRGRNRVELYADTDLSLVQRQDDLQLFRELCMAIEARRFKLLAHAIVPLADPARATEYELLVRLVDSKGALLQPARFLSAAKRYQLLPQLDKGVIELALQRLEPFVPVLQAHGTVCWINITGSTLGQREVADAIRLLIKRSGIPGQLLGFEITESAAIENLEAATRFIQRVRELGCRVALDDFGTGFSSLAYLKSLAAQSIKIDGSFIRDLLSNSRSQALVSAVLEIARQLGLDTVAEYIESAEVAARLKAMGVSYGQGHYYGKPEPLGDLLRRLAAATAAQEESQVSA